MGGLGGLRQGDILLEVNHNPILNVKELKDFMTEINREKPEQIIFFVKRGIHTLFLRARTGMGPFMKYFSKLPLFFSCWRWLGGSQGMAGPHQARFQFGETFSKKIRLRDMGLRDCPD